MSEITPLPSFMSSQGEKCTPRHLKKSTNVGVGWLVSTEARRTRDEDGLFRCGERPGENCWLVWQVCESLCGAGGSRGPRGAEAHAPEAGSCVWLSTGQPSGFILLEKSTAWVLVPCPTQDSIYYLFDGNSSCLAFDKAIDSSFFLPLWGPMSFSRIKFK